MVQVAMRKDEVQKEDLNVLIRDFSNRENRNKTGEGVVCVYDFT